jgi:uncharacterized NAD(P)/FAD-binding protein YdhS
LATALITGGLATSDPAGHGIAVDATGAVAGSTRLFALGAVRRASDWESTAVPEIAVQAERLAQRLLTEL